MFTLNTTINYTYLDPLSVVAIAPERREVKVAMVPLII
jgi:hypothetical protein